MQRASQRAPEMDDEMLPIGKQEGEARTGAGKLLGCHRETCEATAICFLEGQFLCLTHFISHCYERLEECRRAPFRETSAAQAEADLRFLRECSERAANLVPPVRGLPNLERARLFDILLWASELLAKRCAENEGKTCVNSGPGATKRRD